MESTRSFLEGMGLPRRDLGDLPDSPARFPDGAAFRIEIPSTEGPRCLEAVLEEAARLDVPVHRVSQGSGSFLLTDAELDEMVRIAADARVEVSLFAQPGAGWGPSASARSDAGGGVAGASHGQDGVVFAVEDIKRSAAFGVRSVLIADLGLLVVFAAMREAGELPSDMQAKISVAFPIANASTAQALVALGANTLNLVTDLSLSQIAAIRAAVDAPIDFYIESPDNFGGFVRHYELPELIRVASPVYVKFGLRNAPNLYPYGTHLEQTAIALESRTRQASAPRDGDAPARGGPGRDGSLADRSRGPGTSSYGRLAVSRRGARLTFVETSLRADHVRVARVEGQRVGVASAPASRSS